MRNESYVSLGIYIIDNKRQEYWTRQPRAKKPNRNAQNMAKTMGAKKPKIQPKNEIVSRKRCLFHQVWDTTEYWYTV